MYPILFIPICTPENVIVVVVVVIVMKVERGRSFSCHLFGKLQLYDGCLHVRILSQLIKIKKPFRDEIIWGSPLLEYGF